MAHPAARRWRPWIGVPIAVALLYYDSWLPGFSRVVSQAGLIAGFSAAYLAELAGRFVNVTALAAMAIAVAAGYADCNGNVYADPTNGDNGSSGFKWFMAWRPNSTIRYTFGVNSLDNAAGPPSAEPNTRAGRWH